VSEANVEVVREFYDAYDAGDEDRWHALLSPDVVLVEAPEFPGSGVNEGREAALRAIDGWALAWSEMTFVPEEYETSGPRVLAVGRMRMLGEGSGLVFENAAAFQFTIEDGLIARVQVFLDVEEGRRQTQGAA
jgi:ketosteroid isomerase-like protein